MIDFGIDQVCQPLAQTMRRDRHEFQIVRLDIAGDVVEHLPGIARHPWVGSEEAQVGIDPRRDRVVIARPEMAVGAEQPILAADHHRDLGVGLPVDEAIDHLHARALQLAGPEDVLLFVEARLELDYGRHGLARLGRVDQRADDRGLLAGAIECLLDRHHVGIERRLTEKGDHHLEALIWVVDDDVLVADGREAIASMFANSFRKTGRERRPFEIRAILVREHLEIRHAEETGRF